MNVGRNGGGGIESFLNFPFKTKKSKHTKPLYAEEALVQKKNEKKKSSVCFFELCRCHRDKCNKDRKYFSSSSLYIIMLFRGKKRVQTPCLGWLRSSPLPVKMRFFFWGELIILKVIKTDTFFQIGMPGV